MSIKTILSNSDYWKIHKRKISSHIIEKMKRHFDHTPTVTVRPPRKIAHDEKFWKQRAVDVEELPILTDVPYGNEFITNPVNVQQWMQREISRQPDRNFAYVTGGFDCGLNHDLMFWKLSELNLGTILGLEPKRYFDRKGGTMRFSDKTRTRWWLRQCSSPAAIFHVPEDTEDYDELARTVGVYKHPNVIHIASVDDPPEILEARRARAYSPEHFLLLAVGIGLTEQGDETLRCVAIQPGRIVHA